MRTFINIPQPITVLITLTPKPSWNWDFWMYIPLFIITIKKEDLLGYILEIFSMTGQEFEEKYAEYPLVLQKQKALVKILEKNGVSVY